LQRTVSKLEETLKQLKAEALNLRKIAEKAIGCGPRDPAFKKMQEIFATLPDTTIELENMVTDLESRLEFMDGGDENVNLYERKQIERKITLSLLRWLNNWTSRKRSVKVCSRNLPACEAR